MNRRGFLSALLGTGAAMTLDPERLLWRPGAKLISIPAPTCVDTSDALLEQLTVSTRRYIWDNPELVDNIFQQSPLIAMLLDKQGLVEMQETIQHSLVEGTGYMRKGDLFA